MDAGASFEHVSVFLPTLRFTNEMRTTSWIVRETEYVSATPLPNKIEDMLVEKPFVDCLFFDSILPANVNAETRAINQAAHTVIEEITSSSGFKVWLKSFFFNPEAKVRPSHALAKPKPKTDSTLEPGFIDNLFELWKYQKSMKKLRSELISDGKSKSLVTKVAEKTFIRKWQSSRTDRFFNPRLKNIDKTIQELLSAKQYENMVIHYNLLRVFLDRDYDVMVNQTLSTSFIKPVLETGTYNQMVIVLLVRALANAVNKEIWRHFLNCKHEYHVFMDKNLEKKESKATEALKQAGKPAIVQIKEQVDAHLKKP